jgi:Putative transposase
LSELIRLNARVMYGLLFETTAKTLQEFADNPRWLGGTLGVTLVLHTWSQTLIHHPHVHGLVTGGALRPTGQWQSAKPGFLFPVQALSRVFRAKYLDALGALRQRSVLRLPTQWVPDSSWRGLVDSLREVPWVVYLKPPLAGAEQVLEYLARYTHRVAISNERLVSVTGTEVSFRYRPAHGSAKRESKTLRLSPEEFLRRFLLHVLPSGFKRIRHYGLTANRNRAVKLAACRAALQVPPPKQRPIEAAAAFWLRVTGHDPQRCRDCKQGCLIVIRHLPRLVRLPDLRATGPPISR